jgi:hypothetical protein
VKTLLATNGNLVSSHLKASCQITPQLYILLGHNHYNLRSGKCLVDGVDGAGENRFTSEYEELLG